MGSRFKVLVTNPKVPKIAFDLLGENCCKSRMGRRFRVLVNSPNVPKIAFDLLGEKCLLVQSEESRKSIMEKVPGVEAILWATKETLNAEILDRAGPQMKTVGTMSSGYNHIDVEELKRRGIKLGNTAGVINDSVADVAVMLALGASRRLQEGRRKIETKAWHFHLQWMLGQDIAGSTVGIVGLGGIGQAIIKRLKAFNVGKFLYTGHKEKEQGKKLGAQFVSLDTLIKDSDFVISSVPLKAESMHMFDADVFSKMKTTSIFVNVSRGEVVDQDALVRALKQGEIFAAGLDVMTPEPLPPDHELLKLPNCVLTPHLGSATLKTRSAMAELTALNILRSLGGEEMLTPVC